MSESKEFATNKAVAVRMFDSAKNPDTIPKVFDEILAENFQFKPPKAPKPLNKKEFTGLMMSWLASFPDFNFNNPELTEVKEEKNKVKAAITFSGTHSGAAFTPLPGVLPAIEKTGTKVKLPAEHSIATFENGKFVDIEVTTLTGVTGPMAFYVAIGGKFEMPKQ